MPESEAYLEVGTLEGRTLEAAAFGNIWKLLVGCDPGDKYDSQPAPFPEHVRFLPKGFEQLRRQDFEGKQIGLAFYDGAHGEAATFGFMQFVKPLLADEAVLVLDDWDRETVRAGAFAAEAEGWRLLRECPEYGDGLTCPSQQFGYAFGVAVFGFRR